MPKYKIVNYINFTSIDSTNSWAKNNCQILDPQHITCITAQEQTAGRGRFFRKWLSPKGENIYATLYFQVPKNAPYVPNLAQLICICCCYVFEELGFHPQIKWPNDVLLDNKKVAGVLCEAVSINNSLGIVLGFGINVNMTKEILDTIDQPATSLAVQSGIKWKTEEILHNIVSTFLKDLSLLEQQGFKFFHQKYESLLAFKGEQMLWSDGVKQIKGVCHSISKDGRLNLITPSNEIISLSAGELKIF